MKYKIGRPINGISLNGLEWVLTEEDGDIMLFDSVAEAREFLFAHGATTDDVEDFYQIKADEPESEESK